MFNDDVAVDDALGTTFQAFMGDRISYVVFNRLTDAPVHVHMLSLNASWTVGQLQWNLRVPSMGVRSGDMMMSIPAKVNEDDDTEIEDTIIVIFCVGEQSVDRYRTPSEWHERIYLPPVLLTSDHRGQSVPTWLPFVPPPNCLVRHFTIRTSPRRRSNDIGEPR